MALETAKLGQPVERVLAGFIESARSALGGDLKSIVLYGSAAEGKLRKTSDVNILVVLAAFDAEKVDRLREPLRTAHAAIELDAMFILPDELPAAMEAFAVKFGDIAGRHLVLYGDDPLAGLLPSRGAAIARLKQELLNSVLRLRQLYLLRSLREEQAARLIADAAGPLRTCAESLLSLQGKPAAASPKEALSQVAASLPGGDWETALRNMSQARETGALHPGDGPKTILRLIDLAAAMRAQLASTVQA